MNIKGVLVDMLDHTDIIELFSKLEKLRDANNSKKEFDDWLDNDGYAHEEEIFKAFKHIESILQKTLKLEERQLKNLN